MKDEKLNKKLKHILNLNKELNNKNVFDKKKKYKSKKKNKLDPVTKLDKKIELFIKKRIQKSFPKHNVLGEETKDVKNNSLAVERSTQMEVKNWSKRIKK